MLPPLLPLISLLLFTFSPDLLSIRFCVFFQEGEDWEDGMENYCGWKGRGVNDVTCCLAEVPAKDEVSPCGRFYLAVRGPDPPEHQKPFPGGSGTWAPLCHVLHFFSGLLDLSNNKLVSWVYSLKTSTPQTCLIFYFWSFPPSQSS